MNRLVVIIALLLALLPLSVRAQSPLPSDLYLAFVYDSNGDGTNEGVGKDIPIYLRQSGSLQQSLAYTSEFSAVHFQVDPGTYIVEAFFQTSFFYGWLCRKTIFVDKPEVFDTIVCEVAFFLWFPTITD